MCKRKSRPEPYVHRCLFVAKLLVRLFPDLFDVEFTSRMETELDRVEDGEVEWRSLLEDFYPRLRERIEAGEANSDAIIKEILAAEGENCDKCGSPIYNLRSSFKNFFEIYGGPTLGDFANRLYDFRSDISHAGILQRAEFFDSGFNKGGKDEQMMFATDVFRLTRAVIVNWLIAQSGNTRV